MGGQLIVGNNTDGNITISTGGSVNNTRGSIGYNPGVTGTANVTGGNWTNSLDLLVGYQGIGTLDLSNGTVSNTDGSIGYFASATGTGNVTGGNWTNSGRLYVGNAGTGTLNLFNGTVTNTIGYVGRESGSNGTANVTGGNWINSGDLTVGYNGNGTLNLSNGTVSNVNGHIGFSSGKNGTANVTGGNWTNSSYLYVGYSGNGTFNLLNGTVSNTYGYIGRDSGSNGTANVTGGNWTNSSELYVGNRGVGTLNLSNGTVSNTYCYIGFYSGGNGTANITGGNWINSGELYVGYEGNGTFNLLNGTVSNTFSVVGRDSGSNGTANVTGGNWTNSDDLVVGFIGNGTLKISGNGLVRSIGGTIGRNSGSTGLAKVSGGNWTNSSDLFVGIYGNGTLEISGNGTVSASTTYVALWSDSTGTVNLLGGVLATGQVSEGDGTGTVTFNGGTLRLTGNQSNLFDGFEGGDVTLVGAGGTIDTQDFAVATSLGLTGNGSLAKVGNGSLVLTGASDYTGATNINAGGLFVNGSLGDTLVTVGGGGLLGGTGTIAGDVVVRSGALLSPGNSPGILTVGNLTLEDGSTTLMEINGLVPGTEYDRVRVNGFASLNGTLQLAFGGNFTPTSGNNFTLIDTDNPITGNFSSVINPLANALEFVTTINEDYILSLLTTQGDFAPFAQTPNQKQVAGALDKQFDEEGLQELYDYLNGLPGSALPEAFDKLAPEELAALAGLGFANTRNIFNMLANRFRELQNGQQFSGNGLTLWDSSRQFQQSLLAGTGGAVGGLELSPPLLRDEKRHGFFVSGQGTFGDVDGDGNGDDYDFTSGGVILGTDYRIGANTVVGAYAGYQGSSLDTGSVDTVRADSAKFGVYGSWWHEKGSWLTANVGGGVHTYDTERDSVGGTARGDTHGTEINAQLVIGHDFTAGRWTYGPEAELGYTHIWIDDYTEHGSLAPLGIEEQKANSLRTTLAARVSYDWELPGMTLRPYARAGWQHEFMDDGQAVTSRFAAGSSAAFTVEGPDTARNSMVGGAGVQALFSESLSAWLGYSAEANGDYEIHSVNGSLNYQF